eukprot:s2564_g31.t1
MSLPLWLKDHESEPPTSMAMLRLALTLALVAAQDCETGRETTKFSTILEPQTAPTASTVTTAYLWHEIPRRNRVMDVDACCI